MVVEWKGSLGQGQQLSNCIYLMPSVSCSFNSPYSCTPIRSGIHVGVSVCPVNTSCVPGAAFLKFLHTRPGEKNISYLPILPRDRPPHPSFESSPTSNPISAMVKTHSHSLGTRESSARLVVTRLDFSALLPNFYLIGRPEKNSEEELGQKRGRKGGEVEASP